MTFPTTVRRRFNVTLLATNAWEVWRVYLDPEDVKGKTDGEIGAWIEANFGEHEKELVENGADDYAISNVEEVS